MIERLLQAIRENRIRREAYWEGYRDGFNAGAAAFEAEFVRRLTDPFCDERDRQLQAAQERRQ